MCALGAEGRTAYQQRPAGRSARARTCTARDRCRARALTEKALRTWDHQRHDRAEQSCGLEEREGGRFLMCRPPKK